jgi:hypothetical protein
VKKSGANFETWKRLCQLLNRQKTATILNRFRLLNSDKDSGAWTLQENLTVLEHFFAGKTDTTAQDIRDISLQEFKSLENKVNRYYIIYILAAAQINFLTFFPPQVFCN